MEKFKEYIDLAFARAVDKLRPVRTEVYDFLPQMYLRNFCNGMFVSKQGMATLYVANIRLPFELEEGEKKVVAETIFDFVIIGTLTYQLLMKTGGADIARISDAVEFMSKKLGCADYCAEALKVFLDVPKES